jgi:protein translocase SecG subunit
MTNFTEIIKNKNKLGYFKKKTYLCAFIRKTYYLFQMLNILLVVIALLAAMMVLVVLIQAPKGRGLDANFGGAAANNLLGASQSADFIEKLTWGLAAGILVLCLTVAFLVK